MNKTFSYNSIVSIFNYILSSLVAIGYSVFLAHSVGSDGLGKINLILLSISFCNIILNFGIGQSLVFFYSKRETVVLQSLIITLMISFISIFVFSVTDNLFFRVFQNIPRNWVYLIVFISPFIHLKNLAEYYYAAVGNFFLNSGLNFLDILLRIIVSFFFIILFPPLEGFFYAIIVISVLIGLVPWVFILNRIKLDFINRKKILKIRDYVSLINFGIPSYLSVLVAFLSLRVDQFFISKFLNFSDLGIYITAVVFAELPFKVSNAITKVLFANISSRKEYSPYLTAKTLRFVLLLSLILILFIYIFGNYFIYFLYGKSFEDVYDILLFLLPGSFFFNITQIINSDLSGRGYPAYGMRSGIIILVLSILLNVYLIPIFGLKGVAIVSSLTYTAAAVLMVFYFLKTSQMSLRELFHIRKSDFYFNLFDNE